MSVKAPLSSVGWRDGARVRRPLRDFVVLAPGVVFVALASIVVAAIHAHSVARAITC